MTRDTTLVSGVWVRVAVYQKDGIAQFDKIEILVEHEGVWKLIQEHQVGYGPISHITETQGIRTAPEDTL